MKNCNNQKIKIYLMITSEDTSHFEIFPEKEIYREYYLEGCFYVNPNYNPGEESSDYNRKYLPYGEDDFTRSEDDIIFESTLSPEQEDAQDYKLYCDDSNFEKIEVEDCAERECFDYYDGSNWKRIVLEDDFWPPVHERREDLEEFNYEFLGDTKTGSGHGHEEYYRLFRGSAEDIFVRADVSYWQGSRTTYHIIEKSEIPQL